MHFIACSKLHAAPINYTYISISHTHTHTTHAHTVQWCALSCHVRTLFRHCYSHQPPTSRGCLAICCHAVQINLYRLFLSSHINLSGSPSVRPMIVGDIKITRHLWPHFVEAGSRIHCWRSLYLVTLYNLNMVGGQTYEVLTARGHGS
jgi:hypothetical protein